MLVPSGTKVVTAIAIPGATNLYPIGTLGVIIEIPIDATHAYRIRFPDGYETSVKRVEFRLLREVQGVTGPDPLSDYDLNQHVIYCCVVGSRAYGLDHAGSDVDRRGVYLPPADLHWSLYGVPEQLEDKVKDECYWELQKFLVLALKANPNILECLYTPLIEVQTDLAKELIAMRSIFLSKLIYQTYNGYVMSQWKKLRQRIDSGREIKPKHAMHLVRLLLSGIVALRDQHIPVAVEAHRDRLLAIRHGETGWDDIDTWRLELHREFEAAFEHTSLPDRPDYNAVNRFLLRARHSAV